jgi:hypothetical protein
MPSEERRPSGRVEVLHLNALPAGIWEDHRKQFLDIAGRLGSEPRQHEVPTQSRVPGFVRETFGAYSAGVGCMTSLTIAATAGTILIVVAWGFMEIVQKPGTFFAKVRDLTLGDAIGAIALVAFVVVYFAYRQQKARKWQQWSDRMLADSVHAALDKDRRRPVVILRSFVDDDAKPEGVGGDVRLEQLVADRLLPLGPSITIGEPGEWFPPEGAARDYVAHDAWQRSVADWCVAARLVVILANQSPGLAWEFEHVLQAGAANRLLVLVPPVLRYETMDMRGTVRRHLHKAGIAAVHNMIACSRRS